MSIVVRLLNSFCSSLITLTTRYGSRKLMPVIPLDYSSSITGTKLSKNFQLCKYLRKNFILTIKLSSPLLSVLKLFDVISDDYITPKHQPRTIAIMRTSHRAGTRDIEDPAIDKSIVARPPNSPHLFPRAKSTHREVLVITIA